MRPGRLWIALPLLGGGEGGTLTRINQKMFAVKNINNCYLGFPTQVNFTLAQLQALLFRGIPRNRIWLEPLLISGLTVFEWKMYEFTLSCIPCIIRCQYVLFSPISILSVYQFFTNIKIPPTPAFSHLCIFCQ